jgi:ABC-type branched-subunit amino acid transport system substrate-binding protein
MTGNRAGHAASAGSRSVHSARAALAALALLGGALSPDFAAADSIKVGLLAPLSGPGAQIGESAQVGVEYAVKVINAAGGIGGRQVELVIGDSQANPTIGVSEMRRLIEKERVKLVVGDTYSQVVMATMPLLNQAKIPSINVGGSELLTPQVVPYSFSMLVNAKAQADVMVLDAKERLKAKTVVIISDKGANSKTAVEAMQEALKTSGMTLLGTQEYQYGAPDMTPQLLDLKKRNPDALLLFSATGDDTGNVLKGMREIGWKVGVAGTYGAALAGPGIAIAGKEAYDGVSGINYRAWTYCDGETLAPKLTSFMQGLKAFRPDAAARLPNNYVSLWYDALFVLADAVKANGGSTDGPTIAKWIEQNSGAFDGINSGLSASAQTHFLIGPQNLARVFPAEMGEGGLQKRVDCK